MRREREDCRKQEFIMNHLQISILCKNQALPKQIKSLIAEAHLRCVEERRPLLLHNDNLLRSSQAGCGALTAGLVPMPVSLARRAGLFSSLISALCCLSSSFVVISQARLSPTHSTSQQMGNVNGLNSFCFITDQQHSVY